MKITKKINFNEYLKKVNVNNILETTEAGKMGI